jgi:hypothetical protein
MAAYLLRPWYYTTNKCVVGWMVLFIFPDTTTYCFIISRGAPVDELQFFTRLQPNGVFHKNVLFMYSQMERSGPGQCIQS